MGGREKTLRVGMLQSSKAAEAAACPFQMAAGHAAVFNTGAAALVIADRANAGVTYARRAGGSFVEERGKSEPQCELHLHAVLRKR